jgi:ABC-2 type transport system permease protein
MQAVAFVLPPSHVFEGLRALVTGGTLSSGLLGVAAGLSIAYVLAASWLFRRVYRHAVRSGLIARYSAETVS